jgi:RNA polymerase sigma-32 factor
MKAVKRFDPDRGVRLSSYAMQWIRAEMNEYIFKNWRLVKFATTKAHRTLFYNLRAKRDYFKPMTSAAIDEMAERLNVSRRDVMEMEARLAGVEFTLDCPVENDEGDDFASNDPILATTDSEPTRVIAVDAWREYLTTGLNTALDQLNPRERRILQARWLDVGETAPMTLKDLGAELGVSHERVRQIEVATMKKLKNLMQDYRELEAA